MTAAIDAMAIATGVVIAASLLLADRGYPKLAGCLWAGLLIAWVVVVW